MNGIFFFMKIIMFIIFLPELDIVGVTYLIHSIQIIILNRNEYMQIVHHLKKYNKKYRWLGDIIEKHLIAFCCVKWHLK